MTDGLHFSFLLAGTDSSVRTSSAIGHSAADIEFGRVYAEQQSTTANSSQHMARQEIAAAANKAMAITNEPEVTFSAGVEDLSKTPSMSLSDISELPVLPDPASLGQPLQDQTQTDFLAQHPAQLWLGLLAHASDQRSHLDAKTLQALTTVSLLSSSEPEQRVSPPDLDAAVLLADTDTLGILKSTAIASDSLTDKTTANAKRDTLPAGADEKIVKDAEKALLAKTATTAKPAELTDITQAKSAHSPASALDDAMVQSKKAQQKQVVLDQLSRPEDKPFADNIKQPTSSLMATAQLTDTAEQAKLAQKETTVAPELKQPVAKTSFQQTADINDAEKAKLASDVLTKTTEAVDVTQLTEKRSADAVNSLTPVAKLSEVNSVKIQSLETTTSTNNVFITPLAVEPLVKPGSSADRNAAIQLKRMSQYSSSPSERQSAKKTLTDALMASKSSGAEAGSATQPQAGAERQVNVSRLDIVVQPSTFLNAASVSASADLAQTGERLLGAAQQQTASQLQANQLQSTVQTTVKQQLEQLKQVNLLQQEAAGQLRERVSLMVRQNIQVAEIRLDPAELGQMQIRVNMQQAEATVQFIVQQQHAKELLEQQMPRLREMLQQQGISLGEGQVQQEQGRQASNGGSKAEQQMIDEQDDSVSNTQSHSVQHSDRIVDYYA